MARYNIKRKGANFERRLREVFYKNNILCFRVAGSGSTKKVPALDLICVYKKKCFGVEAKVIDKTNRLYIREEQYRELIEINKHIDVYIIVRIEKGKVYVLPIDEYKQDISKDEIRNKGILLASFIEKIKSKKLINTVA